MFFVPSSFLSNFIGTSFSTFLLFFTSLTFSHTFLPLLLFSPTLSVPLYFLPLQLDKSEVTTLGLPPSTSHGGSDGNISVDAAVAAGSEAGEVQRTRAALDHLQQKILKITEQIRVEQEVRDENVAEYLKLAHNADKQQGARIKQVFEKKNQKSAQTIAHLHKKLEHYHKKLKEIEQVCVL